MSEDIPKKSTGFYSAWSKYKSRKLDSHSKEKTKESKLSSVTQTDIEILAGTLDRIFAGIQDRKLHISEMQDRINSIKQKINLTLEFFNKTINKYFWYELTSVKGSLKLTEASDTISIFKKLKQITLTITFTTTRNFSIQKNLSICA